MRPNIKPDLTVQHVGDESLVLDLRSEQIHQLNATATWILGQCNGQNSIDAIAADFAANFSVDPDTAARDVTATIEQLGQIGVLGLD